MSEPGPHEHGPHEHGHLDQAQWLDVLLAGEPIGEGAAACPVCAAERAALEAFLDECRGAARELEPVAEPARRLAERVLARTTREDPSWRGDLAVWGRFVHARLVASRGLRLLAASLVAHLLALPVLAWLSLRPAPEERSFRAYFEQHEQGLPAVPLEPERELEPPAVPEPRLIEGELGDATDGAGLGRGLPKPATLDAERAYLRRRGPPALPAGSGLEPELGALLELRAGRLSGRIGPDAVQRLEPTLGGGLARVLTLELWLDHLVLVGERLPALDLGLERLAQELGAEPASRSETRELERLVLERALGLGLAGSGVAQAGVDAAESGPVGARGFGRALGAALGAAAGGWADWDR